MPVTVPVRVIRGARRGPAVFVSGAIHGDELNGTGIIRELMLKGLGLKRGTLILVPVVNVFGFERHSRYLPDRRDLNRSFPGSPDGSLAFRLAHAFYEQIVRHCDYGIDLHTATQGRVNFPHVRGDLGDRGVNRLARWFGCELVLDRRGHEHSVRQVATEGGCSTIVLEAGESLKIERRVVEVGVRGVFNVLQSLRMVEGQPSLPEALLIVQKSQWARAHVGGLLRFSVSPGDVVSEGMRIAHCDTFFGNQSPSVRAPVGGVVLGMCSLPVVRPGVPVCHIGIPDVPVEQLAERLRRERPQRTGPTRLARMEAYPARLRRLDEPPVAAVPTADGPQTSRASK
jgi:predicted deacylase